MNKFVLCLTHEHLKDIDILGLVFFVVVFIKIKTAFMGVQLLRSRVWKCPKIFDIMISSVK